MCMIKIFRGGRGGDTFKTPSLHEQLLPLTTPYFKMFLERSLNDPPPPHFKHLSLLPPSHPPPLLPPLKILIIHNILFLSYDVINCQICRPMPENPICQKVGFGPCISLNFGTRVYMSLRNKYTQFGREHCICCLSMTSSIFSSIADIGNQLFLAQMLNDYVLVIRLT